MDLELGLFTSRLASPGGAQPQQLPRPAHTLTSLRPRPPPTRAPQPAQSSHLLPLGDRRPSKKHAGTRPLKEPPHGKSSGRRTWRRDRVPFFCLLLLLPGAGRQSLSSRRELRFGVGPSGGVEGQWGSEAVRLVRWGRGTGTKWGAQVILPTSSKSLQPSADTQQQRAGGGVRGREGKGEEKSWCCRCP